MLTNQTQAALAAVKAALPVVVVADLTIHDQIAHLRRTDVSASDDGKVMGR
ncbi:hypothetical protein LFL96_35700 (plasmid) [Paraburkholderia sp. D15]|uniref:hypothetical protein n=1 Tax=Paraburkholderia sp. D15 TaxID=2880218 RepID=UPI002479CF71|nr:hypothetical protein [Paraburkholderia sp. D15]WGS55271.1 hypothetical protein LFL96_35700 [Paraburkholderia sp. D15]